MWEPLEKAHVTPIADETATAGDVKLAWAGFSALWFVFLIISQKNNNARDTLPPKNIYLMVKWVYYMDEKKTPQEGEEKVVFCAVFCRVSCRFVSQLLISCEYLLVK